MAIILAYGMPGSGKSTLLHDLVAAHARSHRMFCQDNEAQWGPDGAHWRGHPPPLRLIDGPEEFEAFASEALEGELPPGVFTFRRVEPDAVVELAIAIGDVTYVNDEIDLIARAKGWLDSPLRAIVHMGRHLENVHGEHCQVHLMGACRRPQNLHTDLTDLADQVYVFRLRGSNTKKRLLADETLETEEDWERLRELPNFHCRHYPSGQWLELRPVGGQAQKQSQPKGQASV
jgi:hypothetical protein